MKTFNLIRLVRLLTICTLLTISFWSCHESDQVIPNKVSKKGAREAGEVEDVITLDEVVVKAFRLQDNDYRILRIEIYDQWGNRPVGDFAPNEGINSILYNLETDSEFPRKIIALINDLITRITGFGLSEVEVTYIGTLTTAQQMQVAANLFAAVLYQNNLRAREFHDGFDGPSNACTHVYLASVHAKTLGPGIARQLVELHEQNQGSPSSPARVMDAYNNEIGLNYGQQAQQMGFPIDARMFIDWARGGMFYTIQNGIADKYAYPAPSTDPGPPKDQN